MKTNKRSVRINDEIKKELSEILRSELKDPRIGAMVSVMKVETTTDLKYCKVAVSVLGSEAEKKSVMEGIKSAAGFIRKLVAERINLRVTPEFTFVLDDSLEYSFKIHKILKDIAPESEAE